MTIIPAQSEMKLEDIPTGEVVQMTLQLERAVPIVVDGIPFALRYKGNSLGAGWAFAPFA